MMRHLSRLFTAALGVALLLTLPVWGGEQPVAIFHAFDQPYAEVEGFVCTLGEQGYSHVQIAPAQKSNPAPKWWGRYQPVEYGRIEGRGSESELRGLIDRAHGCGVKVIADVVFNHMADMPEFSDLDFPEITKENFHPRCGIDYFNGSRQDETDCWLGSLPDLDQEKEAVRDVHEAHLQKLLGLGVDGFRFDAAKHIPQEWLQDYIDFADRQSSWRSWNYLEVIEDGDTRSEDYNGIAAVSDFRLYRSMKNAFSYGGDLRRLRIPEAVNDWRSVTFGRNHDTIEEVNPGNAINPYIDPSDSYLATAYVLARERGTPLVLNWDNRDAPYIPHGVKFRQILRERRRGGAEVRENVLAVIDSPTVLMMERGEEGFFVVNKGADRFDIPALDLTLTHLEGCYRELRNGFTVAVERRGDGRKYITRWGTYNRGGMEVQGRDALYFIREPWEECR